MKKYTVGRHFQIKTEQNLPATCTTLLYLMCIRNASYGKKFKCFLWEEILNGPFSILVDT